ncbi:TetR/AcrR family transcriptional regulator [Sulfobacillus thermosulfidooxidans]|uniref:TetR/AcrR family transcriptional regulator n=1 Tax=Sulfobacillus thermosulfidooxidans TaxID=28034 RepID=UPI0006B63BC8|nr:TetR/AcrR family transcriptional regulator [Sulfobacillus thermosulfidooxidans]
MDSEDKREDLLRAAAAEFAAKGFDRANINEIAINAGLGKGTVYLYFSSKKDLYLAVLQYIVDQFNAVSETILALPISPMAQLAQAVEAFIHLDPDLIPFARIWVRHQFHHTPEFREDVDTIFAQLRQPFCEIVESGVARGEFATSYPTITGYFILSLLVMIMPELDPPVHMPILPVDRRVAFVLETVRKMLARKEE